ncbi:MAG: sulfur carrier protein ThiS [Butyricicoccus sp.]
MVTINGEPVNADGMSVADYLAQAGYNTSHVAVERNLEIVPRAQHAETILQDGDTVEIVRFVGGG